MIAKTARQIFTTYVAPVLAVTAAFALVLAYGPAAAHYGAALLQGTWDAIAHLVFNADVHPATGLGCWDEIKNNLPTEHICGMVGDAPAGSVNFTSYPTPKPLPF